LDLDDSAAANHIFAKVEHSLPSWWQSSVRSYKQGKIDATSSKGEGAFTIQFGSLEPVVVSLAAQILTAETSLASNDGERWMVVTRRKPSKSKQTQAPALRRRKRQGKKKSHRHIMSKKRSKTNKRQEI